MFIDIESAIEWLLAYRYLVLIPISILEGPIITIVGGFLTAQGYFNAFLVYLIVVLGDVIGDFIYYFIGRWGKESLLGRLGRWFGITPANIAKLESHFRGNTGKTLAIGKFTHAIGLAVLVAAGAAKVPIKKFFWYNFFSSLPKSLILFLIGYYFGEAYRQISSYFDYLNILTVIIAVVLIGIYWVMIKFSKKEYEADEHR